MLRFDHQMMVGLSKVIISSLTIGTETRMVTRLQ